MPGFFDDLKKSIEKGSKVVATRSSSLIEANKLKQELNTMMKERTAAYTNIGKAVVEAGEAFELSAVFDDVAKVNELSDKISEKEEEIKTVKASADEKINDIYSGVKEVDPEEMENATEVDIEVEEVEAEVVGQAEEVAEDVTEEVQDVAEAAEDAVEEVAKDSDGYKEL